MDSWPETEKFWQEKGSGTLSGYFGGTVGLGLEEKDVGSEIEGDNAGKMNALFQEDSAALSYIEFETVDWGLNEEDVWHSGSCYYDTTSHFPFITTVAPEKKGNKAGVSLDSDRSISKEDSEYSTAWINLLQPLAKHQIFPFLLLPAELRIHIYRLLLHGPRGYICRDGFSTKRGDFEPCLMNKRQPQIMRLNKQIHKETVPILYSEGFGGIFDVHAHVGRVRYLGSLKHSFRRYGSNTEFIKRLNVRISFGFEVEHFFPKVVSWMQALREVLQLMRNLQRLTIEMDHVWVGYGYSWERASNWLGSIDRTFCPRPPRWMLVATRLKSEKIVFEPLTHVRGIQTLEITGGSSGMTAAYARYLSRMMTAPADIAHETFDVWPSFPFLRLPAELRNEIYRLVLQKPKPNRPAPGQTWKEWAEERKDQRENSLSRGPCGKLGPHLLRTCRQIYSEAASVLYEDVMFVMQAHKGKWGRSWFKSHTRSGDRANMQLVEHLRLFLNIRCRLQGRNEQALQLMEEVATQLEQMPHIRRLEIILNLKMSYPNPRGRRPRSSYPTNLWEVEKVLLEPLSHIQGIKTLYVGGMINKYSQWNLKQPLQSYTGSQHESFRNWFPFLRLPSAIRNQIYRLVLQKPKPRPTRPWSTRLVSEGYDEWRERMEKSRTRGPCDRLGPHLLRVNRQIKDEAAPILYEDKRLPMKLIMRSRGKLGVENLDRYGEFAQLIGIIGLDLRFYFNDYSTGENNKALEVMKNVAGVLNNIKNLHRLEIKLLITFIVEEPPKWWKKPRGTNRFTISHRACPEPWRVQKAEMFLLEPLSHVRGIGEVIWLTSKQTAYREYLTGMMRSDTSSPHEEFIPPDAINYGNCRHGINGELNDLCVFRFLDLPPEMRNKIYRIVLLRGKTATSYWDLHWQERLPGKPKYQAPDKRGPHILQVNQQIYHEAVTILYGETNFHACANSGTLSTKPLCRPPGLWKYGRNLALIVDLTLEINFSTDSGERLLQIEVMVKTMCEELKAMKGLRKLKLHVRQWDLQKETKRIRRLVRKAHRGDLSYCQELEETRSTVKSLLDSDLATDRKREAEFESTLRLRAEQFILEPLSRVRGSAEVKISGPVTNAYKLYLKEMMEAKRSVPHRPFRGLSADGHRECEPASETLEQM